MNLFWLDASALVMRYSAERGSPQINLLFSQVSGSRLLLVLESVGEVISVLVRKRNSGALTKHLFHQAITNFTAEIIYGPSVRKLHPDYQQVRASWGFIERYSLNSTDAIILRCALDEAAELRLLGHDLVLVSADARLIGAAQAEGLRTFNPETDDRTVLDALIATPPEPSS
ncbi:MAG: type II toxin-antitoxin system VapC family toxin [Chthonomonadetes bacterium]|nr:type II toxin-antitoxin system VapC family toxin [Chthonomonadetes bacterium]